MLLDEGDHAVHQQQNPDDRRVGPMPDEDRKHQCHFDHPRDGRPEIAQEDQDRVATALTDLVWAVTLQSVRRIGGAQTFCSAVEFVEQLLQWHLG